MFNLVGEVPQSADGNRFFWGILRRAIRLGEIWNHHLCIAFGTKSSRLQKGQSIKYTLFVLKNKFKYVSIFLRRLGTKIVKLQGFHQTMIAPLNKSTAAHNAIFYS